MEYTKVIKGKLLVKEIPNEKVINGIIIPDTALDKKQRNGVCVIGGEEVKANNKIIYIPSGIKVTLDEEEFTLINERDVLLITE